VMGQSWNGPFRKSKEPVFFCAKDAAKFHTKTL
jgi:hypothetical protein